MKGSSFAAAATLLRGANPRAAVLVTLPPLGPVAKALTPVAKKEKIDMPDIRSDLAHQLELLARSVALCRERGLVIAFSPLDRQETLADPAGRLRVARAECADRPPPKPACDPGGPGGRADSPHQSQNGPGFGPPAPVSEWHHEKINHMDRAVSGST